MEWRQHCSKECALTVNSENCLKVQWCVRKQNKTKKEIGEMRWMHDHSYIKS